MSACRSSAPSSTSIITAIHVNSLLTEPISKRVFSGVVGRPSSMSAQP